MVDSTPYLEGATTIVVVLFMVENFGMFNNNNNSNVRGKKIPC